MSGARVGAPWVFVRACAGRGAGGLGAQVSSTHKLLVTYWLCNISVITTCWAHTEVVRDLVCPNRPSEPTGTDGATRATAAHASSPF